MAKKPIDSNTANKNELTFNSTKISKEPSVKIKLYDANRKPVENYAGLKVHNQKNWIDVILTFSVTRKDIEFEEEEFPLATYSLINLDSEEKYLANKKRALIDNLYKNKLDGGKIIELDKEDENLNNLVLKCLITKSPSVNSDELRLDIKITADSQEYNIQDENVRLFGYFNLPKKIEYDELITFPSPPKTPDPF